ncbi:MAG: GNAT famly N-acetyltransferase [Calditrichaeota bacterium]|nr:MAG: GNAT famly N-acetyltransferase [Calditrichota bacterium]
MFDIDKLEFKKLDLNGLKTLVSWAETEGWNPGLSDTDVFWKTDPDGFLGFYFNNSLIAGGAIVSYNDEFGFMGLFIVKSEYRNLGIGKKLWYLRRDMLIERLKNNSSIGMDGVVDMQPFYQKGGFEIAFIDKRYEKIGIELPVSEKVKPIVEEDFNQILDYDKKCFGFIRPQFLKLWLNLPESRTYKYSENNELKGFAVLRKCSSGFKIGPLFADNDNIAEELYKACLNSAIGNSVYLDIPMINNGAVKMVGKYNAKYVFECARMYKGSPPQVDVSKVYGITTFELG